MGAWRDQLPTDGGNCRKWRGGGHRLWSWSLLRGDEF
jgi:hypothetical protein